MIEFETSAIVITALIEHMTDEIMDQFVEQGHVPVVFVKQDHEMFVQMKEKEKENEKRWWCLQRCIKSPCKKVIRRKSYML